MLRLVDFSITRRLTSLKPKTLDVRTSNAFHPDKTVKHLFE